MDSLSLSGVAQSKFGIICATTLNQASLSNLVASIDSLFQCHLLFSKLTSSEVVWYHISTLVTQ